MARPRILGIIPARGGSKGIPGKNIRRVDGRPLLAYTVDAARASAMLTRTIVSTDSPAIARVARRCGAEVPFLRPAALAADRSPTVDAVAHALATLERIDGQTFDYVAILEPTSPLRTADDIDRSLRLLVRSGADSVVSVCELPHHQHPSKLMRLSGAALQEVRGPASGGRVARRQELEPLYYRNGAIYACTTRLVRAGRLFGGRCVPYLMRPDATIDIDGWDDLRAAARRLRDRRTG